MMNLPDKNSKYSTALEHVVDPASVEKHGNKRGKNPHILRAEKAQPHLTYQTPWIILKWEDTWNKLVWTVTGHIFKAGTGSRIKTDRGFGKFRSWLKSQQSPKFSLKHQRCRHSLQLYLSEINCASLHGRHWLRRKVRYEKHLNTKSSSTPRNWTRGRST